VVLTPAPTTHPLSTEFETLRTPNPRLDQNAAIQHPARDRSQSYVRTGQKLRDSRDATHRNARPLQPAAAPALARVNLIAVSCEHRKRWGTKEMWSQVGESGSTLALQQPAQGRESGNWGGATSAAGPRSCALCVCPTPPHPSHRSRQACPPARPQSRAEQSRAERSGAASRVERTPENGGARGEEREAAMAQSRHAAAAC
jgi:hypothetical protein